MSEVVATAADKIRCEIDGQMVHSIQAHISANYAGEWSMERYAKEYPDAPLLSPFAIQLIQKKRESAQQAQQAQPAPAVDADGNVLQANLQGAASPVSAGFQTKIEPLHQVFDFGDVPAARSKTGNPIPVTVLHDHGSDHKPYIVPVDQDYVFNIDLVKKVVVGLALNKPLLLWGMHGTGKTTVIQQVCARLGRPVMRVQHTINMQESDVLGQWVVRNGQTEFQLGPLPMAMLFGWTYVADEYDFAMPSVTAVYQPVLEGQPLIIKDAPLHLRKITPHPEFRFAATGNTNGCGDETGLYQGTLMQNAANYSRFGVTEEVRYMEPSIEAAILRSKANMPAKTANQIVDFANRIRESFGEGKMSMTISPREMIAAAQLGLAFGDWKVGLDLAFINRLPRVDQKVARELVQRSFG